jgi:diguanylate cyclase (GGDEF)-like protein
VARATDFLFGRNQRIGRRMVVLIIAFSSLITLLISAAQLALEYRYLRDALDETLDGVRLHVPSMARSVWDYDEQKIQLTLDALAQLPNITQISVSTSGDDKRWQAGKAAGENAVARRYPLRHAMGSEDRDIGTLEVLASLDAIYRQVASHAVSIVLGNALKTFLVALFMVALFRRLVTNRLETLAGKVRQRLGGVTSPATAAPTAMPTGLDELDAVDWVLDRTATDLARAMTDMRGLNEALATQVAEKDAALREQAEAERKIEFIAYHDSLTGLPNQQLAMDRVQQAIAFAGREHAKVALLFLDLDNFKGINDSLGHDIGDAMLKEVTVRLGQCLRSTDTLSRQGGDEFLVVLADVRDAESVTLVADALLDQLKAPFEIEHHRLVSTVSIGIAVCPDDGRDFGTLLRKADTAMYHAKASGRNTYRFYTEQMNIDADERLKIRNWLGQALEHEQFVLHYQPQIDLASGAMVGAEALIRLQHPLEGLVSPGRFIPVAEDSGLIIPIGEWVLRQACKQAAAWRAAGWPDLVVAVNLSAVQFKRHDLEKTILDALAEAGLPPANLELELTESLLIENAEHVLAMIKQLKAHGLRFSIDDFGTGYSSLAYLKRFSVDRLKIDQSFVRDLLTDPEDAAIIRAIIQMARTLGVATIAEGVEDDATRVLLHEMGCIEAQGYWFGRPLPPDKFSEYLSAAIAPAKPKRQHSVAYHHD